MKLAAYLKREDLTMADFAREIGVSHQSVRLYILGKRFPRPALLAKIKAATKGRVDYYDFVNGAGSGPETAA